MRFLVDHDVYFLTVEWLRRAGHDVVTAKELGLQRAADEDLLAHARTLDRLFLSRDKDFGALVFLHATASWGVIFLRVSPTTVEAVHREIERLLQDHTEEELKHLYCVVEPHCYRIRHLPQS